MKTNSPIKQGNAAHLPQPYLTIAKLCPQSSHTPKPDPFHNPLITLASFSPLCLDLGLKKGVERVSGEGWVERAGHAV
ncbi:hypothetical protein XELAEV_18032175mg [Xenopus laevis]|uniref:Uncharacterized protein n=1 Tax=Xenopus laevis TaxID=8355 RepID=A0A974CQK8_XENLA|nr:hypothetical protein XELAEV_18032175mg [Xenopus laevis]